MGGMLLKEGYDMLREAWQERKQMKDEAGHADLGFFRRRVRAFRIWTSKWTTFGVVLTMIAFMQISLGIFQIIAYTGQQNFINCQAKYNQQSSVARSARLPAAATENDTFYDWLETLPPLLATPEGKPADPEVVQNFTAKLAVALQTHRQNVKAQKENPYPPEPDATCGDN